MLFHFISQNHFESQNVYKTQVIALSLTIWIKRGQITYGKHNIREWHTIHKQQDREKTIKIMHKRIASCIKHA